MGDVLLVIAAVLVVSGLALLHPAAGLIGSGVLLAAAVVLLGGERR